jgi:hypothetical protein
MKQTIAAPEFAHYSEDWHLSPVLNAGAGDSLLFSARVRLRAALPFCGKR